MAEKNEAPAKPEKPEKQSKGGFSLIIVLFMVMLTGAIAGGVTWFMITRAGAHPSASAPAEEGHGHETNEHGKPSASAEYLALGPTMVVNLADEDMTHYLQVEVQVLARQKETIENLKLHDPQIRNNLLLLFAQQKSTDLRTREGRAHLQEAALEEVQKVLKAETGKAGVEALYFTNFVTQ